MAMIPEEIEAVFLRPGMFVVDETYQSVTTFIEGYHYGKSGLFHLEFRDWLLNEFKVRSCQHWPSYVAYIFERKNNEPFETLPEKEKLKYLHEIFQSYYKNTCKIETQGQ